VTLRKLVQLKGKDIGANHSTSSSDKTRQKISDIEWFKCGGHAHKKIECPNHHVVIVIVDGAYDKQSEDENAHDDPNSDEHFETFEYEAEDDKHELGLNCLVRQTFVHAEETKSKQIIISTSMEEITCAGFAELLMEIDSDASILTDAHYCKLDAESCRGGRGE
jgi:hypothetical protein